MKKLLCVIALVVMCLGSVFAATRVNNQVQTDTIKKISIKPMKMRRDTMIKKPMKKDTTKKS